MTGQSSVRRSWRKITSCNTENFAKEIWECSARCRSLRSSRARSFSHRRRRRCHFAEDLYALFPGPVVILDERSVTPSLGTLCFSTICIKKSHEQTHVCEENVNRLTRAHRCGLCVSLVLLTMRVTLHGSMNPRSHIHPCCHDFHVLLSGSANARNGRLLSTSTSRRPSNPIMTMTYFPYPAPYYFGTRVLDSLDVKCTRGRLVKY